MIKYDLTASTENRLLMGWALSFFYNGFSRDLMASKQLLHYPFHLAYISVTVKLLQLPMLQRQPCTQLIMSESAQTLLTSVGYTLNSRKSDFLCIRHIDDQRIIEN